MITVYPSDCTDFTANGAGTLSPISCEVTETLNGEYELILVHPLDDMGKWQRLATGNIIKAPVPNGTSPYVNLPDNVFEVDKTSRGVWRFITSATVWDRPGSIIKKVALGSFHSGDRAAIRGSVYFYYDTTSAGQIHTYAPVATYPSTTPADGYATRKIEYWYSCLAYKWNAEKGVSEAVTGYIQAGVASNVYHETDYQTVVGDVLEEKPLREQPFRIYRVVPELDKVTVYARHIFYDLMDNFIREYSPTENDRGAEALKGIGKACEDEHQFSFYSDITDKADEFELTNINPIEGILGEGGFIDTYGGELARDWYDAFVVKRVGHDTDVSIREGKNLLGISYDVDDTDVITRIMPTGETKKGETLYLPELFIDSPNAANYPNPKWTHLAVSDAKVSSKLKEAQVYEMLREAAQAEFDKGCDMPTVTLDVDFINVFDTEEYKQYGLLQNIFIGDAVRVVSSTLGIDVSMRMTQYTYDCLLRRYTAMTLGTAADTLATNTISARQLPTGIISGSKLAINAVGTSNLQDGAVLSAKIAEAAIETAHIVEAAITTAKIYDGAITNAKIENGAITNAKIEDAAINTAKIEDLSITTAKIANEAVDTAKIKEASITTALIVDAAISSAKIDDLAVTAAKIALGTITNAQIANATIDTAQIALGAITSALIARGAVGTAQIADASITDAKIVSLNADVITSGTLATERLIIKGANGLIYEINAESGTLTTEQLTEDKYKERLDGSVLVAKSVTADQIAARTITSNEILAGTITAAEIAAATIEGSNIKAGEITTSHLAANVGETLDLSSNTSVSLKVSSAVDEAKNEITSRGTQLITNGTGMLGDNTNFERWTYDPTSAYLSSTGSFKNTVKRTAHFTTEYIALTGGVDYRFEFDAKTKNGLATMYSGFAFYDADKLEIGPAHVMYLSGTTTALKQDLNDGDTVVYLEDLSAWSTSTGTRTYQRRFIFWNYTNSFGYTYPAETYSRNGWSNLWEDANVDKTNNTITLSSPWSHGTIAAGTQVSQGNTGNSYNYIGINGAVVPADWTHYSGTLLGEINYTGAENRFKIRPGAAYCRVMFMPNYNQADDTVWITNVSLKEDYKTSIDAAQSTAYAAQAAADSAQSAANDAQDTALANTRAIELLSDKMGDVVTSTTFDVYASGIQAKIESQDEILSAMSFSTEGLKIQMAGSIYYTLTDDVGYHIYQNDKEIASFSEGGAKVDELLIGKIICKKTSKGGWVWIEADGS